MSRSKSSDLNILSFLSKIVEKQDYSTKSANI